MDQEVRDLSNRGGPGIDKELLGSSSSIAEIASELGWCRATSRHWLRKWDLKTLRARRQEALRGGQVAEDRTGRQRRVMICEMHGEEVFAPQGRAFYRCVRCRSESVARDRRRVEETRLPKAGGRCVVCGYDRHPRALEFHHHDPREKRLGLSAGAVTLSLQLLR